MECRFSGETVWFTQSLLAELFGKDIWTINEHLQNLYIDGEQDPVATIRKFRIVRPAAGVRMSWRLTGTRATPAGLRREAGSAALRWGRN